MSTVLQINNLSKSYGSTVAINNLNLQIEKGHVFGILGPNGSGKTTTLSIILGTIKANNGTFTWFNQNTNTSHNKTIGSLLEQPNFYPYLTVYQNLEIASLIKEIANPQQEIARVLQISDLTIKRNAIYRTLSFGMKQRLALASLLLGDPEVLVLDEPTNGLDPEGIVQVREIIKNEARNGKTIILASHILDEVEKVCSHVAILKKGNLLTVGSVNDLLKADDEVVIVCDKINDLFELLKQKTFHKSIDLYMNKITLVLQNNVNPAEISEFIYKNGFVLTKFDVVKKTLEDHFLEITK